MNQTKNYTSTYIKGYESVMHLRRFIRLLHKLDVKATIVVDATSNDDVWFIGLRFFGNKLWG
jgi:hypothetical protein